MMMLSIFPHQSNHKWVKVISTIIIIITTNIIIITTNSPHQPSHLPLPVPQNQLVGTMVVVDKTGRLNTNKNNGNSNNNGGVKQ